MKRRILIWISNFLVVLGVLLIVLPVGPALFSELKYFIKYPVKQNLVAIEGGFSVSIPKIGVESKVIEGVDPFNKDEYLKALKLGVAHAKTSALPGEVGSVYLFAHSTDAPWNISRYNAEFYLLDKLVEGDVVKIRYQGVDYKYLVKSKRVVPASDISMLSRESDGKRILVLQTCWPLGTTWKRLLVVAEEIN